MLHSTCIINIIIAIIILFPLPHIYSIHLSFIAYHWWILYITLARYTAMNTYYCYFYIFLYYLSFKLLWNPQYAMLMLMFSTVTFNVLLYWKRICVHFLRKQNKGCHNYVMVIQCGLSVVPSVCRTSCIAYM